MLRLKDIKFGETVKLSDCMVTVPLKDALWIWVLRGTARFMFARQHHLVTRFKSM